MHTLPTANMRAAKITFIEIVLVAKRCAAASAVASIGREHSGVFSWRSWASTAGKWLPWAATALHRTHPRIFSVAHALTTRKRII